eukprot:scaffold3953_cov169-Amphora_coffeaeformis.AAC.13
MAPPHSTQYPLDTPHVVNMKRIREEEETDSGFKNNVDDEQEEDGQYPDDLPPPVQCWDEAVVISESLIRDAKILWETYGGDKKTAKSFWVDSDAEPSCQVEAMALEIADFHLQGAEYAGVEIWTQFRTKNNGGLGFHFDKDEQAAVKDNAWKHPVVGTATYLMTGGAPLVVFATASPEGNEESHQGDVSDSKAKQSTVIEPVKKVTATGEESGPLTESHGDAEHQVSHAWVCYPRKGRHVAFAYVLLTRDGTDFQRDFALTFGNLLHGVPHELALSDDSVDRLSLLVNIWLDHKPSGVESLSSEVVAKLHQEDDADFLLEDVNGRKDPLQALELRAIEPLVTLKEHVPGDTAPLPVQAIRAQAEQDATPFVQISYLGGLINPSLSIIRGLPMYTNNFGCSTISNLSPQTKGTKDYCIIRALSSSVNGSSLPARPSPMFFSQLTIRRSSYGGSPYCRPSLSMYIQSKRAAEVSFYHRRTT